MVRAFDLSRPQSSGKGIATALRTAGSWVGIGGGGSVEGVPMIDSMVEEDVASVVPNNPNGGYVFDVGEEDITVVGLRVYAPLAEINTITLWDDNTQALLASVDVDALVDQWVEGAIDPVVLTAAARYRVASYGNSTVDRNRISVSGNVTFNPLITYVTGCWGSKDAFPGDNSSGWLNGITDLAAG